LNGSAALANSNGTLTLSGANFGYSFPSYSMTVLDVKQSPTVTSAAAATVSSTDKTAALSALGSYNGTAGGLTYTWSTVGTPPAAVSFSPNGTSASNNSTATFSKAGTYTLEVTITGPTGTSTTSSVVVTVPQKLTGISLGPLSSNLATSGTQQFSATALDQFGNALTAQPTIAWSVVAGPGAIDISGRFTPPYVAGSSTIQAASGGVDATQLVALPGPAIWSQSAGGSWNSSANWQSSSLGGNVDPPGTRGNIGDDAELEPGSGSITLDGDQPILAALTISSTSGYTIAPGSGGVLQMESGAGNATIAILAGNNTISANIDLLSNTTITVAQNTSLTISGNISGAGSLTITGSGAVTFAGSNTFTGNLIVNSTLDVSNGALIANSLTVGNNSSVTIEPSSSGSNTAVAVASANALAASDSLQVAPRIAEIAARKAARAAQLAAEDEQSTMTTIEIPTACESTVAGATPQLVQRSEATSHEPNAVSTAASTTNFLTLLVLETNSAIANSEANAGLVEPAVLHSANGGVNQSNSPIQNQLHDGAFGHNKTLSEQFPAPRGGSDDLAGDASSPVSIDFEKNEVGRLF
jgi:autotransporter-associated beta strand protein